VAEFDVVHHRDHKFICIRQVSEILGTLLLGESALEYIPDARSRLCKENCHIIPAKGRQCVQLIECPSICQITAANDWNGIVLENFNALQDTVGDAHGVVRKATAPSTDTVTIVVGEFGVHEAIRISALLCSVS